MGTNCAVYLANWYLFTYELKFVRKVIEAGRLDLLLAFKHSKRYIDDCLSINNPFFWSKFALPFCNEIVEDGISGIYPDSLELNEKQFSINDVHFLDVRIEKIGRKWTMSIYDKREWAHLKRVQNNKFPDIDSFL